MSAVFVKPPVKAEGHNTPSASPAAPAAVEFHSSQTDGSPPVLAPRCGRAAARGAAVGAALAADDRCRLNGVALVDGRPKYATALGDTDTAHGWRANKPRGGCLMEVSSGEVISRGLSMPHSPRWHDGRLWLLESGTGQLVLVDAATRRRQTVTTLPGFTRGLALCGPYAFIGLASDP